MLRPFIQAFFVGITLFGVLRADLRAAVPTAEVPAVPREAAILEKGSNLPLGALIRSGDCEAVGSVLASGVSPDGQPDGVPPLLRAAFECRPDIALLLLQHGADPDASFGPDHITALLAACQSSCRSVARLLIEHGADPHAATQGGVTPLMAAAWWGSAGCLRELLSHDPDLLAVDHQGHDAVYFAALRGHAACLGQLLEAGARADRSTTQGWTALLAAARSGCAQCVALLIEHRADPSQTGPGGVSVVDEAVEHCHADVVSLLIDAGVKPTRQILYRSIDSLCPTVLRILLLSKDSWTDVRSTLIEARKRVDAAMKDSKLSDAARRKLESCLQSIDDARAAMAGKKD